MADHDALQAQFVELTGADAGTAHFYLESSGWKLDAATAMFFDNAGGSSSPVTAPTTKPAPPVVAPVPHAAGHPHQASAPGPMPTSQPNVAKRPPGVRSGGGPRVKTLGEMREPDSDEEDEDKEQSYYAGGAASGQVVKSGAKKPAAHNADVVKDVFESAKSHGAEVVDPHEHGGKEEKAKPFEGTGFRLGTAVGPSTPDPATVKKPAAAQPKDRLVVITFWRSGFSVDDGALRRFDDPANKPFLQDVHSGHIPRELQALAQGAQLNVNLVDKSHEDYTAPKPVLKPFAGSGQKLGTTSAAPAPAAAAPPTAAPAAAAPPVDASQPSTTLQIRLADGTRMVAKFNITATVADLRQFIDASRVGSKNYQLQTPMPVVILSDPSKSLKELGLLNATVIQKML